MLYLPEIDGLRALAVCSVLFFHLELETFSGGFVGVDVFFVISGYLITRIILVDVDRGRFSPLKFYERRIRRIAPALLVTLTVCCLFVIVLPPSEARAIEASILAALLSFSNFWFYFTTDYFSDNSMNPILHTWSLAVEEQFYIAFPVLILVIRKLTKRERQRVLIALWLLSLIASEVAVVHNQQSTFYFPWYRAWELLTGSILAGLPLTALSAQRKDFIGALGLLLIAIAVFTFTKSDRFPGLLALVPVVGSAAVIAGAGGPSPLNAALRSSLMRFLGRISYSLYLVHWPLISLVKHIQPLTAGVSVALAGASILIAYLSWRYVEMPFRQPSTGWLRRNIFAGLAASMTAVGIILISATFAGRTLWLSRPEATRSAAYLDYAKTEFGATSCFLHSNASVFSLFSKDTCLRTRNDSKNVLVIGDSHSAHLMAALASRPSINWLQASASGCPPTLNSSGAPFCVTLMQFIFQEWLPAHASELDSVILSARWNAEDRDALEQTVRYIDQKKIKVTVVGPSPEFRAPVPLLLAYEEIFSVHLTTRLQKKERFDLDRELSGDPVLSSRYFSVVPNLCPGLSCLSQVGGVPLYFDRDHFTREGAMLAIRGLSL